jgi:hypothetical protein
MERGHRPGHADEHGNAPRCVQELVLAVDRARPIQGGAHVFGADDGRGYQPVVCGSVNVAVASRFPARSVNWFGLAGVVYVGAFAV